MTVTRWFSATRWGIPKESLTGISHLRTPYYAPLGMAVQIGQRYTTLKLRLAVVFYALKDSILIRKRENKMGYLREMANEIAAQCWATEKNKHKDMDPDLAEEFANRLTAWLETLAQAERNKDFYQGLLDQCAEHLGPEAYTDDDGTLHDSPMRIKLPSMVRELVDVWKAHRKGLFVSSTVMTSRCQESYAAGKVDGVNEDVNNRCERMVDVKYRDRVIHSVNFELAGKIKKILVYAEEVGFEEGKAAGVLDGISRNNKRWIDYLRDNYDTGNVLSIGNQKYLIHTEDMTKRLKELADKEGRKWGREQGRKEVMEEHSETLYGARPGSPVIKGFTKQQVELLGIMLGDNYSLGRKEGRGEENENRGNIISGSWYDIKYRIEGLTIEQCHEITKYGEACVLEGREKERDVELLKEGKKFSTSDICKIEKDSFEKGREAEQESILEYHLGRTEFYYSDIICNVHRKA